MKVGDLVMVMHDHHGHLGVIVGFDKDGDPLVYECEVAEVLAHYTHHIEVIG